MFSVHTVRSGSRSGLLLEKGGRAAPIERGYFYQRGPLGLGPNEQIVRACREHIHEFTPSKDEGKLIDLLVRCCDLAEKEGGVLERLELSALGVEPDRITRKSERCLNRKGVRSALRLFLGSYDDFKIHILEQDHGKDTVQVKAVLGVLQPYEVMPDEELDYLQHARRVLKVGEVEKAEWFWRQGPRAIDFDKDVVYRRTDRIDGLKKLVFDHPFSVLEGKSATGKTVLVRNLLYDLLKENHARVYHFAYRPFGVEKLAREVNSVRGVVVLEDIHRDMLAFQRLYSLLRSHPQRHVLFTARSHFRDLETESLGKLGQLPSLSLKPFEDVEGIVRQYCSQHPDVEWPAAALQSVKEVAKESFWLLAFALEGYEEKAGRGDPKEWTAAGAKQALKDIEELGREELGRQLAGRLPQVLVALSPLYLGEVCTAETFLVNGLGLELAAISALVDLGEVTEETSDGAVLYGLPHSGLAAAYWEHGTKYRNRLRLPDYEDFLYKYAVANTPNGLTAVTSAGREVEHRMVKRLSDHRTLAGVLAREKSLTDVMVHCASVYRLSGNDDGVLKAVAARIIAGPRDWYAGLIISFCFEQDTAAWDRLWHFAALERLANELCGVAPLSDVGNFLGGILFGAGTAGRDLCKRFPVPLLARRILKTGDACSVTDMVRLVWKCDPPTGTALWHMVRKRLAALVNGVTDYRTLEHLICFAADTDRAFGREVLSHVQLVALAQRLNHEESLSLIAFTMCVTCRLSRARGRHLWQLVDRRRLAAMCCIPERSDSASMCVRDIYRSRRAAGRELWTMIQEAGVVEVVDRTPDARVLTNWMSRLGTVDPRAARSLWAQVNRSAFASKVSALPEARSINSCITALYSVDRDIASELCGQLQLGPVAATYVRAVTSSGVSAYARMVEYANGEVGRKLWEIMERKAEERGIEIIRLGRQGDRSGQSGQRGDTV